MIKFFTINNGKIQIFHRHGHSLPLTMANIQNFHGTGQVFLTIDHGEIFRASWSVPYPSPTLISKRVKNKKNINTLRAAPRDIMNHIKFKKWI